MTHSKMKFVEFFCQNESKLEKKVDGFVQFFTGFLTICFMFSFELICGMKSLISLIITNQQLANQCFEVEQNFFTKRCALQFCIEWYALRRVLTKSPGQKMQISEMSLNFCPLGEFCFFHCAAIFRQIKEIFTGYVP